MSREAAFFDIDGTLYRDSLMIEHFKKLIKYEIIDERLWLDNGKDVFNDWDKRQGNYDDYMNQVSVLYVNSIKGLDKSFAEFAADQVIKLKADRVYKYTRSRIKWHLDKGHLVIFISGSPDFLVERMANKYNVTDFKGSEYKLKGNKFTGEIIPMWDAKSKNKTIDFFVEKYNIDLSKSYAYGDTNGDFSMFQRVKYPTAINPSKEFLINIKEDEDVFKKTNIIIERKDLIYKLDPSVEFLKDDDLYCIDCFK